ncbi:hypothetical protein EJ110_NYTH40143 [Nymphaea thermarum]|nr:hypothetical protein EJ110_NYTH40143 [Nymphaea thermarum]
MMSRGLFGWSPPHIQPLTPVSEVSEPPEWPSPYLDSNAEALAVEDDAELDAEEEIEPPPAAVPFSRLFACADGFDWVLMIVGSLAAAAHGAALVVYLHFFGKVINLLRIDHLPPDQLFDEFKKQIALLTLATGPFIVAAGRISNIFLHRLAENIQDAYAEAASIAEQILSTGQILLALSQQLP